MRMKLPTLVKEWLIEFKTSKDGYLEFHLKYFGNKKFYSNLVKCLENKLEVESICHQIYNLALSKLQKLILLLLDMLPSILTFFLTVSSQFDNNRKIADESVIILRSCLMGVKNILYNKFFSDQGDTFTIPGFTDGSIYHSSVIRPDLDVLNQNMGTVCFKSPINEKSEQNLFPNLIKIYNYNLNNYSSVSLNEFCILASMVVSLTSFPRIIVSNNLLMELAVGIHSIIFKQEHSNIALDALDAIELRANHELMTDVILIVSAIQNFLIKNPPEKLFDSPIVADAISHNRTISVGDALITNANFRPSKVSEDIEAVKELKYNISSSNVVSTDVDLNDISICLNSIKVPQGVKNKSKIKFNVVDHHVSNGDTSTSNL